MPHNRQYCVKRKKKKMCSVCQSQNKFILWLETPFLQSQNVVLFFFREINKPYQWYTHCSIYVIYIYRYYVFDLKYQPTNATNQILFTFQYNHSKTSYLNYCVTQRKKKKKKKKNTETNLRFSFFYFMASKCLLCWRRRQRIGKVLYVCHFHHKFKEKP